MIVPEPRWPGVPQLRMRRPTLDDLPPVRAPDTYHLRAYRPGDELAWLTLLRATIGPSWTERRWHCELTSDPLFDRAGLFFAVCDEQIVGSASARDLDDTSETPAGYLQLVAVRAEHRGHKLGQWLSLQALRHLRARGRRVALLDTEDHRLAAIELYLRLGFEPLPIHPSHAERWAAVLAELGRANGDREDAAAPRR